MTILSRVSLHDCQQTCTEQDDCFAISYYYQWETCYVIVLQPQEALTMYFKEQPGHMDSFIKKVK